MYRHLVYTLLPIDYVHDSQSATRTDFVYIDKSCTRLRVRSNSLLNMSHQVAQLQSREGKEGEGREGKGSQGREEAFPHFFTI